MKIMIQTTRDIPIIRANQFLAPWRTSCATRRTSCASRFHRAMDEMTMATPIQRGSANRLTEYQMKKNTTKAHRVFGDPLGLAPGAITKNEQRGIRGAQRCAARHECTPQETHQRCDRYEILSDQHPQANGLTGDDEHGAAFLG